MLVDDFVLRQIQQIADMLAALAGSPSDALPDGALDEIDDAYRNLLGMDPDLADALDAETLLRGLNDARERDALVDLTLAHAEAQARSGDPEAARSRLLRALAFMQDDDARAAQTIARYDALADAPA